MRDLFQIALVVGTCLSGAAMGGVAGERLPKYTEPTDEYVSEHITWNKPSANGPLKVLFIVPQLGAREIVETCERFDIEREVHLTLLYDTFAYDGRGGGECPWPQADEATATRNLKDKLAREYDCLVIGHIKWEILPEWARNEILEKVRHGTGLVYRGRGKLPPELTKALGDNSVEKPNLSGYPFAGLPLFRSFETPEAFRDRFFKFCQVGKGRVVVMDNYPFEKEILNRTQQILTPECTDEFPDLHQIHYDYYQALLGHLFAWVSNAEPQAGIRVPEGMSRRSVERDQMREVSFNVVSAVDAAYDLEFVLRESSYGDIVVFSAKKAAALRTGENREQFPVRNVPAGRYFADLCLKT